MRKDYLQHDLFPLLGAEPADGGEGKGRHERAPGGEQDEVHPLAFEGFRKRRGIVSIGLHLAEHLLAGDVQGVLHRRSEEHTSELQSLMRISYAVFCLKKKT